MRVGRPTDHLEEITKILFFFFISSFCTIHVISTDSGEISFLAFGYWLLAWLLVIGVIVSFP